MGLFDSGIDFTGWGLVEWSLAALGGYVFLSMVNDTRRIAAGAARTAGRVKRKLRRRRRTIRPMQGEAFA